MTDQVERDRRKGLDAQRLLDDPLIAEAFDTVKEEYVEAWRQSPARDAEGRERLWIMVKLVDKVRTHLQQVADQGKIADAQLTEIEKRKRFGMF